MSTAKKQAKAKPQTAVERFRKTAVSAFDRRATWIMYSPGAKIVRVNVEDTVDDGNGGRAVVRGHDVDIPIAECDGQILAALKDALGWAAEDLGAEVAEPPEEE